MKNNTKTILLAVMVFVLICVFTISYNTIDMDYWARLLQGDAFWQLGHILKTDPFSYTKTHIWLDHEWGSSVIFSFVQNTFGFNGILLLKNIIIFLIFFLIYRTVRLQTENTNYNLDFIYFICMAFSMPTMLQSSIRCHFFTFLFFTLYIYILELVRKKENKKLLLLLPLIMLFWSNIHGGCVSGLGLLGIYAVGEFLNKKSFKYYIYTLLACLAVLFINPYGIDYVKFIFMASTMSRPLVTEWISAFSHPNWMFLIEFKVFYFLNLLLLLFCLRKIKTDYTKYIILIVCAYLSYKYVKNTPFFIIVSAIFFYDVVFSLFAKISAKLNIKIVKSTLVMMYIIIFSLFVNMVCTNMGYSFLSQQPVKEVEFLKINNLNGRVLAPFDMGSYIAYKLYPKNLIYMDGRYEEVYFDETKKLLDDFYSVQNDGYKILEGDTTPDYIIVPKDALLNDYLMKIDSYKIIYETNENYLYSISSKLKDRYVIPTNDEIHYIYNAFTTNFKFTDEITINGQKVIFK